MSKVSAFVAEQTSVAKMHERLNAKCADCGLVPGNHCREHFAARILELEAELVRLRGRVHANAVRIEPFDCGRGEETWIGCSECNSAWPEGEPEDHRSNCDAALPHKCKSEDT